MVVSVMLAWLLSFCHGCFLLAQTLVSGVGGMCPCVWSLFQVPCRSPRLLRAWCVCVKASCRLVSCLGPVSGLAGLLFDFQAG